MVEWLTIAQMAMEILDHLATFHVPLKIYDYQGECLYFGPLRMLNRRCQSTTEK
jgi:hypothetical protein